MNWRDYDIFMVALCAWREARSESEEGVRAVMHVIRNRVYAWKKGWVEIITKDAQFTSMNPYKDTYDPQLDNWPATGDAAFGKMMSIAAVIYNGGDDDPTDGALYYWNPRTATSGSFKKNIASRKQRLATIGNHDFYSDRDNPGYMPSPPEMMGEA